jgi:protein TonB
MMSAKRPLLVVCLLAALASTPASFAFADETAEQPATGSDEPTEAAGPDEAAAAPEEATKAPEAPPIQPPRIILKTQRPPEYPPAAKAARFEGVVTVDMTVLKTGDVGEVKIVDCTHRHVGFEEAAQQAVKKWRFEPATQEGEPVEYSAQFRLNFRLVGKEGEVSSGIPGSQGSSTGVSGK